ncbi:MAG TPA: hypothetical protein VFD50_09445, partial [Thermoleophilia bacterium]|nr:hypothetical protein [Thermoleophilia bacterium]
PYHHTQIGYPMLAALVFGVIAQLRSLATDLREHKPRLWLHVPGLLLFATVMAAFSRLVVDVDGDAVTVGYAGGLARRRIDPRQIERAETTKTAWYAGWGIRFTPDGLLYNAWGRKGVKLRLVSGKKFTIGSDEPELLLAAIEAAQQQAAESVPVAAG